VRKVWAVALKEVRQIRRDPLSLLMLLGIPAFMLVVFGYAISFDVEHVKLGVQDRDLSPASRDLIDSFTVSGRFDLAGYLPTDGGVRQALETGRMALVLVIPEDYSRNLAAGRQAPVQLLIDGSDSNTATTVLGYASGIAASANARLLVATLEAAGLDDALAAAIRFEPRVWYNPELQSSHFLVPGLIAFILMLTAVLSTALSLVREAERGTLEQLRVSPVHSAQILVGKIFPYLLIALFAVVLILVVARLLFGIEVKGPYEALFLVTILFLVGGFGFGLLISTIADSQAIAFQLGLMTSLLPTLLLSGFIFPIYNMPKALQILTYAFPARYYLVTLRGVILKGTDLTPYWDQVLFLAVYTLFVLTVASVRFARQAVA
jgi:ABC-2 type transport system permease protein